VTASDLGCYGTATVGTAFESDAFNRARPPLRDLSHDDFQRNPSVKCSRDARESPSLRVGAVPVTVAGLNRRTASGVGPAGDGQSRT
jgi:hypothetical protein